MPRRSAVDLDPTPRTVTYSQEYLRHAEAIEADYRRLDEMMRGAEWVLARTPLRGEVIVTLNPGGTARHLDVYAEVTDAEAVVNGIRPGPI